MNDDEYARGLAALIKLNEDQLRPHILQAAPEIRHDVNVMTDLFRELVKIERAKMGLDQNIGLLHLAPNKDKTEENKQPDLIGTGQVAGHHYDVAGWVRKNDYLEIILSEPLKR